MKQVILFVIICAISSCKEENSITHKKITGKVLNAITNEPVANLSLEIGGAYNCISSCDTKDLDETVTDENGEFTFFVDREHNYKYGIEAHRTGEYDSLSTTWNHDLGFHIDYDDPTKDLTIYAENAGWLYIMLQDQAWDTENIEWVFVETTHFKDTLSKDFRPGTKGRSVMFMETPLQFHTIKWIYKRNGIISPVFTDEVYVPSYFKNHSSKVYQIKI